MRLWTEMRRIGVNSKVNAINACLAFSSDNLFANISAVMRQMGPKRQSVTDSRSSMGSPEAHQ